jgi:glycosyltransferase involved in cell wall biosynthesis
MPFDERTLTHVALPGKVPQYIRAGLPVVATPLRGLQELLPEGAGVTYRSMGAGFLDAIEQLLDEPEDRKRLVESGNERLDAVATWKVALAEFESVLNDATTKRRGRSGVG